VLQQALEAGQNFRPLSEQQVAAILEKTAQYAKGEFELYKTSRTFDGTAQHPEWLG
jgi:hypothetical protein